MRRSTRRACTLTASVVAAMLVGVPRLSSQAPQQTQGQRVYDRWCSECHGSEGRGDGSAAAYMFPRPRDFTGAVYQIRSTASGSIPTDADIRRVIDEGMPGTAMPGWAEVLSESDRDALVEHLKTFSRFFRTAKPWRHRDDTTGLGSRGGK